jgi:type II secretory pathway predicted ATPase ExeA
MALALDLEPAHLRGDLVRQISDTIVRLNQNKKQHPILILDEAQLLRHAALEQLPLLLNFDMDSSHYVTLLLLGQPLLRRTLSSLWFGFTPQPFFSRRLTRVEDVSGELQAP